MKFPIAYYFAESYPRFAPSTALPRLVELAELGTSTAGPDSVRLRAAMLVEAIEDFAQTRRRALPVVLGTLDR